MKKQSLSVVLATKNEEDNIGPCLNSTKSITDEIIIFDEESTDRTCEIAKKLGAKVFSIKHEPIFHKTKQKALDKATGDWILQLDADERVSQKLASEIRAELGIMNYELRMKKFDEKKKQFPKKWKLFNKHQKLIEERGDSLGNGSGQVVAYFIPRVNYFLGSPLKYAGVYPDGVIRLIKNGKASFPAESVHELMEIDGEVAWLFNDLEHHDSPTFYRYLQRANRYTDLTAMEFKKDKLPVNYWYLFKYSFLVPSAYFLNLYFRHKGFLDGMRGFVWSVFSALHHPIAYFKYWSGVKNKET
ncbi:glycosyltransferase family 2 protein [Patescibacteria group bacterium]|nr:glycosyltransferase family 2 protein [Patescibacteria group bacterium]